jgi:hypothetical protein
MCVNSNLSAVHVAVAMADDDYFLLPYVLQLPPVQAMRSGELNKECNRRTDILSVINEFHQACFFDFVR